MIQINYPSDLDKLKSFESEYNSCFRNVDITRINKLLKRIPYHKGILTFEKLILLEFNELIELEPIIKNYSSNHTRNFKKDNKTIQFNRFDDLFDYKSKQPDIARFFMQQKSLNFSVCHYCGIDYINAFIDIDDYFDGLDFINRANIHDLQIVVDLGPKKARGIIDMRKKKGKLFTSIDEIGFSQGIRDQINNFDFKNGHNHFTLDHVLPQKTHKFFSLCLYNFVPSCSSCNTKFKGEIEFSINSKLNKLSPTSAMYSLADDLSFEICFSKDFKNLKEESDFVLTKHISDNINHIQDYLAMFKIDGRYKFHKDQILKLIKNKQKYPESIIKHLSDITGFSKKELRIQIFGRELFEESLSNQPLVKFKRDIAKNLNIEGVI